MTSLRDALASCAGSGALEQRAHLLEAIWNDLSGRRSVARDTLPAILLPNPAPAQASLGDYAVDLAMTPDGFWWVLRDRVGAHPGTALLGAPLLAAFLPALCRRLLGQSLLLPSWPVLWFRDPAARARLAAHPARFCVGDGLDPEAGEIGLATATPDDREALQRRVESCPDRVVARLVPGGPRVRVAARLPGDGAVRTVTDVHHEGCN